MKPYNCFILFSFLNLLSSYSAFAASSASSYKKLFHIILIHLSHIVWTSQKIYYKSGSSLTWKDAHSGTERTFLHTSLNYHSNHIKLPQTLIPHLHFKASVTTYVTLNKNSLTGYYTTTRRFLPPPDEVPKHPLPTSHQSHHPHH